MPPEAQRDRVAAALIDPVLRELFQFGVMQTDLNLANDRYDPKTGRIVLLDFGAVQPIAPELVADFRSLAQWRWTVAWPRMGRDLAHAPPATTLSLHRKTGGMYLMAAKLRARVALRPIVGGYCDMDIAPR